MVIDEGEQRRDELERLRAEIDRLRTEHDDQLRAANERAVLANLRADTLAEQLALHASEQRASAEAAKDRFLARLGHELRNPLAPVLTVLQGMALSDPTSFVEERALMERQVKHLVRLVDDLLDVSRVTRGTIELRREPLEMADVVVRAVELVRPLLESKAHRLIVKVAPVGFMVDGDPGRLAQVVANVLHNAATYTPDRGRIVVTCDRRAGRIALSVRDSGVGMSPTMLARVFDPLAQEARGPECSLGGLGLGLAIVRGLVTMHGGTVKANSAGLNHGSELTIELPASQLHGAEATRGRASNQPRRILLVDDNGDYTRALAHVLTALGHLVEVASDGPAALAIVERAPPEVVLLDLVLPGMDGYEIARRLRAVLSPNEVPIIAVSGHGQEIDHRRSQDAGFFRHLVKPVDLEVLLESIRAVGAEKNSELPSP